MYALLSSQSTLQLTLDIIDAEGQFALEFDSNVQIHRLEFFHVTVFLVFSD